MWFLTYDMYMYMQLFTSNVHHCQYENQMILDLLVLSEAEGLWLYVAFSLDMLYFATLKLFLERTRIVGIILQF